MKRKFIILSVVILIVVLSITQITLIRVASNYQPKVDAVFALVKIDEGIKITPDMLEVKKINVSDSNKLAVKSINDVVGKKAKMPIEQDELFLSSKVISESEYDEMKVLNKENRLFSVEFKPDQVNGWWLLVDQKVDIIFVPTKTNTQTTPVTNQTTNQSKNILNNDVSITNIDEYTEVIHNLRVAAIIDDKFKQVKNENKSASTQPKYVVLEVTPEQAEFLAYCKSNGRLEIAVIPQN